METQVDINKITPASFQPKKVEAKRIESEKDYNKVPQKRSVFLVWLFSLITFGVYPSFWFLNRSKEFRNLGTQKKVSSSVAVAMVTFNIFFLASLVIFPLTITSGMGNLFASITTFQTILLFLVGAFFLLYVFFCLLNSFYSRSIINQALEGKGSSVRISGFFTFIFSYLYLQYEINRIMDDKEDRPKRAPWIFFVLLIVIIALGIIFGI